MSTSVAASESLISAFHYLHTPWFDLRPAFVVSWPGLVNGSADVSPKALRTWDTALLGQFMPISGPACAPARGLCECPGMARPNVTCPCRFPALGCRFLEHFMHNGRLRSSLLILTWTLAFVAFGCSNQTCSPGSYQYCNAAEGCTGVQSCSADGSQWGLCDCGTGLDVSGDAGAPE